MKYLGLLFLVFSLSCQNSHISNPVRSDMRDRLEGMLLGSLIGDAAGGPYEFQSRKPLRPLPRQLNSDSVARLSADFALEDSRRPAEPFGYFRSQAPVGSLTDDSRHKILFFQAAQKSWSELAGALAREWVSASQKGPLWKAWLKEYEQAGHFYLSQGRRGLPPDRLWGGIPNVSGQMVFLPLAGAYPGQPESAYRATWTADFFEVGQGKDMTAAIVAGLSAALTGGWKDLRSAMLRVDPFHFDQVPWVPRKIDWSFEVAEKSVQASRGNPKKLFKILEKDLQASVYWEAWVPLVVSWSMLKLTQFEPLAAMQLVIHFGHDVDSSLQLLGAWAGAIHGRSIFPVSIQNKVLASLKRDEGVDFNEWVELLVQKSTENLQHPLPTGAPAQQERLSLRDKQ